MSSTYAGTWDDSRACGMGDAIIEHEYSSLHRRAVLGNLFGRITGRQTGLRSLGEALDGYRICGQRHIGLKAVRLDEVVGSEGRSEDFDSRFRPLQTHTRARWFSIGRAHEQDVPLPAIDLIKVGDAYFVRDGNHRVSVAKARGQYFIDANVTELQVAPRPALEVPALRAGWAGGLTAAAAA